MIGGFGKYHVLEVNRRSPNGVYLQFGSSEVLLPNKYVPEDLEEGHEIKVFIYKDSEDRPVATTLNPAGIVGEYVALEVVETTAFGVFMDWGLEKHLLDQILRWLRRWN